MAIYGWALNIMKRPFKTDWESLATMSDEEIDYSDIPPMTDAFFERAKIWRPQRKVSVTVELDEDILDWFKMESEDWNARIQTALRLYVEANKAYQRNQGSID